MKNVRFRSALFLVCLGLFGVGLFSTNAEAKVGHCGCYDLRAMCGKLGGKPQGFPSHGLFCVIKKQPAHAVGTLSYRMQDFPKDCAMFGKKLNSNLGKLIKAKRLTCAAPCPVNKSFHVGFKCKCPKGTRFGAVSAAYRMCKTPIPPSCGANKQFRAGTYCRCPKGTKEARAAHHLFRICRPISRVGHCGCYNLRAMCGKLGGKPQGFASHGLFCVIKKQPAHAVGTLSYRMQDFPKDCAMFGKKLNSNLGKLIKAKRLTCR